MSSPPADMASLYTVYPTIVRRFITPIKVLTPIREQGFLSGLVACRAGTAGQQHSIRAEGPAARA